MNVNHGAGAVAPVSNNVTYGTVTIIPGEPTKCWITSNLGADHQATSVDDATEASAGWCWQFNLKPGYKHDGLTLTPAWSINSINDNSDWLTTNDPCSIELGSGWRVPTLTEWSNVDANGSWTTWTDPWNSGLKLHVAGYLSYFDGSLMYRGYAGALWSSSQFNASIGSYMFFQNGVSATYSNGDKAFALSLRCIKD